MRVVIVGAGYGGVTVALRLARSNFPGDIVLVNEGPYHQLMTQMHRVAAGAVAPSAVLLSIESLLRWTGARFVHGKVTAVEPEERRVRLEGGDRLTYDRLVVALGSELETFGVTGVREHTLAVQPVQEALRTRRHLTARLHDAAFWDGEQRRAALRVVIVGGGLTGVELAGELADGLPAEARRLAHQSVRGGDRRRGGGSSAASRIGSAHRGRGRGHFGPQASNGVDRNVGHRRGGTEFPLRRRSRGGAPGRRPVRAGQNRHLDRGRARPCSRGEDVRRRRPRPGFRGRLLAGPRLSRRLYRRRQRLGRTQGETRAAAPTAQNAVQQAAVTALNLSAEAAAMSEPGAEAGLRPYTTKPLGVFVSVGQGEAVGELAVGDFWKPRLSGVSAYALKWAAEQRYRLGLGFNGNKR